MIDTGGSEYAGIGAGGTTTGGLLAWSGGLQSFCVQLGENVSVGQSIDFEVVGPESLPDAPPMPGPMRR